MEIKDWPPEFIQELQAIAKEANMLRGQIKSGSILFRRGARLFLINCD